MNQQSSLLIKAREAVASSKIPFDFSTEVIKEMAEIESEFKWPSIGKRMDLRGKTTFTLGSTEVAFSVERKKDDFILGIHTADVANLFAFGSAIDKSAFEKGKSAVLPGKVHPMIPEAISSFCSLLEGEECFTVSVFVKVSPKGKVGSLKFAESVIKLTANCEPEEVEALLFDIDVSSVGFLRYKYQAVLSQLEDMFHAGAILKMARENRGAEDIDTAVRVFSRKGIRGDVVNVGFKKLSDPERLVREVISAAGVEISKFFSKNSVPCPHRNRPPMSREGNVKLREFLDTVCIDTKDVEDKNLVSFTIDKAHGDRNEEIILAKEYAIKQLLYCKFAYARKLFAQTQNLQSQLLVASFFKESFRRFVRAMILKNKTKKINKNSSLAHLMNKSDLQLCLF